MFEAVKKEYLNYLYDNCMEVLNRKQKLEYYMRYSYSRYERFAYAGNSRRRCC